MTTIYLQNVSNDYILKNINLSISDGELFVLLGPSGSGKTTLLKAIAGLIKYYGRIFFDHEPIDDMPPEQRNIGYVPQEFTLFPHLNVEENISYGLKARNTPELEIKHKVNRLLKILGIYHLRKRYPKELSGGEKQRVAIARALAIDPKVLLLDEPLSNLDARTSKYLREWLRIFIKELGITTILVTHDISEAEELSDRVGILYQGSLEQIGKLNDIMSHPNSKNVISFLGLFNIFKCNIIDIKGPFAEVECSGMKVIVPYEGVDIKKIVIPPREIIVSKQKFSAGTPNTFEGIISGVTRNMNIVYLKIKVNDNVTLTAELTQDIFTCMNIRVGEKIFFKIRPISIKVMK